MDAAAQAVAQPIRTQGADIDDAALDVLFDASGGYPYFLQEYGRAAWEVSAGPTISAADAQLGIAVGLERLDAGFFSSRWNRATKSERRMLIAMAGNGDEPAASSDVARRMGLKSTSLGPYRASLIGKGLIYAPDHGLLAYTAPNMAAFVARRREELA